MEDSLIECLVLRLDSPLMSFGGVCVDHVNPTDRFPGRSLITGLIGNALGLDRSDFATLSHLQKSLRFACRWDAEPASLVDYQTVDLGHDFMQGTGWTTRGRREDRGTGSATKETHQRYRHYWANGCATVIVNLGPESSFTHEQVERALKHPVRPLYFGRKACVPAAPLFVRRRFARNLLEALCTEPLAEIGPRARPVNIEACWPSDTSLSTESQIGIWERYDIKNWHDGLHTGSEQCHHGFIEVIS